MSHHLSGPHLRSPMDDARLDLTDLFAFTVPGGRTALIMNVNPIAPTGGTAFHPDAVYRINVDTDGDNQADIAFSFTFSDPAEDGEQTLTLHRATGAEARIHEAAGTPLFTDVPVSFGRELSVTEADGYKVSAGLRSDPFFADLDGIVADFTWTGTDWGADKNVFGIALEVPDGALGDNPRIGVWARVSLHTDGELKSVDRGAHPPSPRTSTRTRQRTPTTRGNRRTTWRPTSNPGRPSSPTPAATPPTRRKRPYGRSSRTS